MSKVVLHIGTHKTATTTIQDTFHHNSKRLAEAGFVYPIIADSKITGHHGLVSAWGSLPNFYRLEEGSRMTFLKLAQKYGDKDVTVFLSSEEFSRGREGSDVDFDEVRHLLSGFDEIEVVCTLRNQWQFLQSIYQEISKTRLPDSPPKVAKTSIETGMWQGLWVDYNLLLDRLLKTFDETEITFLDFDAIRNEPDGVIGAFLARYCPSLKVSDLETVNGGASNVSPMPLATWVANALSDKVKSPSWLVELGEAVIEVEYGSGIKTCIFNKREFEEIAAHFEPRNQLLQKRRQPYQPEFSIAPFNSSKIDLLRGGIQSVYWLRLSRRLAHRCSEFEKIAALG